MSQAVVVCAFNPSPWEAEAGDLNEFKIILVYRASCRMSKTTQRKKPSLEKQTNK